MRFISHRGNTEGSSPKTENTIETIEDRIWENYDVEIDILCKHSSVFLGHDDLQEEISVEWLLDRANFLWIHAKNCYSLELLSNHKWGHLLNYFYHNNDPYTITSKCKVWGYPGSPIVTGSIFVLPEQSGYRFPNDCDFFPRLYGICSDYIKEWRDYCKLPLT